MVIVDKWRGVVDNISGLGENPGDTSSCAGDGLGMRAGVCVDWHRCARCVKDDAGEMWIGYPHVVRTKSGVVTRVLGVIPTFHSTTTSTDYLYLSMNVTC